MECSLTLSSIRWRWFQECCPLWSLGSAVGRMGMQLLLTETICWASKQSFQSLKHKLWGTTLHLVFVLSSFVYYGKQFLPDEQRIRWCSRGQLAPSALNAQTFTHTYQRKKQLQNQNFSLLGQILSSSCLSRLNKWRRTLQDVPPSFALFTGSIKTG